MGLFRVIVFASLCLLSISFLRVLLLTFLVFVSTFFCIPFLTVAFCLWPPPHIHNKQHRPTTLQTTMGSGHGTGVFFTFLAIVLGVIATVTHHWLDMNGDYTVSHNTVKVGLFETCSSQSLTGSSGCDINTDIANPDDKICGDHTVGQMRQYFRAMQAFTIAAVVFALVAFIFGFARGCAKRRFTTPSVFEGTFTTLACIFSIITWALFLHFTLEWYGCGQSYCSVAGQGANNFSCGYNYSFALAVASSGFLLLSAAIFFATGE